MPQDYQPSSYSNSLGGLPLQYSELVDGPHDQPQFSTTHEENLDFLWNLDTDYLAQIIHDIKSGTYNPHYASIANSVAISPVFLQFAHRPSDPQQDVAPQINSEAMTLYHQRW
ncbi:hypothetical protein B7494_g1685 [Chlorociboria aeruginascens]|nr:hypothetical protein B7494_g1685 [Chlorociboria aeruginascens]